MSHLKEPMISSRYDYLAFNPVETVAADPILLKAAIREFFVLGLCGTDSPKTITERLTMILKEAMVGAIEEYMAAPVNKAAALLYHYTTAGDKHRGPVLECASCHPERNREAALDRVIRLGDEANAKESEAEAILNKLAEGGPL